MSVRGIEIHNGYVAIPADMIQKIQLGTWSSPITQGVADQLVFSGVVTAVAALGGDISGGYFGARVEVAFTGDVRGLRARASVLSDVALTGYLYGIHTEIELGGTSSTISGRTSGHTIEIYSEAGCVHTGDVHGLFVNNYMDGTVTVYQMLRLESGGSAVPSSIIAVYVNDAEYAFHFTPHTPASLGWSLADDKTGGGGGGTGWLRVDMQGTVKYIQLY